MWVQTAHDIKKFISTNMNNDQIANKIIFNPS